MCQGLTLLKLSVGVVGVDEVDDNPFNALITPLILFLAAKIIDVKLNAIINTNITIAIIQIYLIY